MVSFQQEQGHSFLHPIDLRMGKGWGGVGGVVCCCFFVLAINNHTCLTDV